MIIKKYNAPTEKEAIIMAKEELGPDAIVMNVKTIKPRGIMCLFKKSKVELTAAIDDNVQNKTTLNLPEVKIKADDKTHFGKALSYSNDEYTDEAQNAIEEKINNIAKLLEQQMNNHKNDTITNTEHIENELKTEIRTSNVETETPKNKVIDLVYNQLIANEVNEIHAKNIIDELPEASEKQPIDNILANTYQKIVLKLGEVKELKAGEKKPKIVFFVGNTGVGKTTTMAKIASKCKLDDRYKIAMFSVDTYRIAAIEQIKTYANILNSPLEVIYSPEEMKAKVEKYEDYDLILVDTAGRSHNNEEQRKDLQNIIASIDNYDKEIYLVISATIKYKDMFCMAKIYEDMFDYKLIFTKLDETSGIGNILNLKLDMNKCLSYVTWGQNVPEDIGVVNPQIIAKKLLGGNE